MRVEVNKIIKNLKSLQVSDTIISCMRSPCDKIGLGYIGKSPCKEDSSLKSLKFEFEDKAGILQNPSHRECHIRSVATPIFFTNVLKKAYQELVQSLMVGFVVLHCYGFNPYGSLWFSNSIDTLIGFYHKYWMMIG